MPDRFSEGSPKRPILALGELAFSLLAVALLALHLHAINFHRYLNSDFLIAYQFAQDYLQGAYPLDGWSFGSATFLFPDYPIFVPLVALFGGSGLSYLGYAFAMTLLLGAAMGFAIRRSSELGFLESWAWGNSVCGFTLFLQYLPGHELTVYRLVLPAYHGSCQILGIIIVALFLGSLIENRPLKGREKAAILALGSLGAISNALLITQYLLPWLAVLIVFVYLLRKASRDRLMEHALLVGIVIGTVLGFRLAIAVTGFWEHARLFREYPLPAFIWEKLVLFLKDFVDETGPQLWGAWLLLSGAFLLAGKGFKTIQRNEPPLQGWAVVSIFATISVVSAVGLTIAALYWKNFQATRYFLNLLPLPALALGNFAISRSNLMYLNSRYVRLAVLIFVLGWIAYAIAGRGNLKEDLEFSYPDSVEEFDRLVDENGLSLGLCDYWHGHFYNTLSRSDAWLNQIREDGSPYFWCNNAYWYFDPRESGNEKALSFSEYDFVLLNGLDEAIVRDRYGEPDSVLEGAHNRIYVYRGSSNGIHSTLVPKIAERLEGKSVAVSAE